jgi:hypothetical protein
MKHATHVISLLTIIIASIHKKLSFHTLLFPSNFQDKSLIITNKHGIFFKKCTLHLYLCNNNNKFSKIQNMP